MIIILLIQKSSTKLFYSIVVSAVRFFFFFYVYECCIILTAWLHLLCSSCEDHYLYDTKSYLICRAFQFRSVTFRFQSTVWKQLTSSWNNRIYTSSHMKSVFQTSQHFLVKSFLSRNRYCLLYFHLEREKLNKRSQTESKRERGSCVRKESVKTGAREGVSLSDSPLFPNRTLVREQINQPVSTDEAERPTGGETNTGH